MAQADINDLITHREAWRAALLGMIKLAETNNPGLPGDDADLSYWQHELTVFDRTFSLVVDAGE